MHRKGLTHKQELFCRYYLRSGNISSSAREAGVDRRIIETNAHVHARIQEMTAAALRPLDIDATRVLQAAAAIAFHDASKISQMRRARCHGSDWGESSDRCWDGYRERRRKEIAKAQRLADITGDECEEDDPDDIEPPMGPDPDCRFCHGEGITEVWFADTRDLGPLERMAFSSANVGKDGYKVTLQDRMRALELLAKHFGLYKDAEPDKTGQCIVVIEDLLIPPPKDATP